MGIFKLLCLSFLMWEMVKAGLVSLANCCEDSLRISMERATHLINAQGTVSIKNNMVAEAGLAQW